MNLAAELADNLAHIGQAETEALDVVAVAGIDAVEFVENLLEVVALYADAVVGDAYFEPVVGDVAAAYGKFKIAVLGAVLYGVVEQVEDYVGEVHLVDLDDGVHGVEVGGDAAAVFLNLELEGVDDVEYHGVGVDVDNLESTLLAVEHAHLEHLLDLEAQALGLVVDYGRNLLEHGRTLAHALVVEHLRGQADTRNRRLELMGHVVDEVVLHLGEFLLPEGHDDCIYEDYQQYKGEGECRHHEGYRAEDVVLLGREIDLEEAARAVGIVGEEGLDEHIVAVVGPWVETGALVEYRARIVGHGELEGHLQAEGIQLLAQIAGDGGAVGALVDRTRGGRRYDVENHLVHQAFLIEEAVAVSVAGVAVVAAETVAVGAAEHRNLILVAADGQIALEAGGGDEGILYALLLGSVGKKSREGRGLHLLKVVLEIMTGLVLLQAHCHSHQALAHTLRELLVAYLYNVFHIENLNAQKPHEGYGHHNRKYPDCRFLHQGYLF